MLHQKGYDLKGFYSLEEYYARDLHAYYEAMSRGESHNYYMGRAEANITPWLDYFITGMAVAFERVLKKIVETDMLGISDQTALMRTLDPQKRKSLVLFREFEMVTAKQISELFDFKPSSGAYLCRKWVNEGFLAVADFSRKSRKYKLAQKYAQLVK